MTARTQIQSHWDAQDSAEQREAGVHAQAEEIAAKTADLSPKPRAGQETTDDERERKIREAAEILTKDAPEDREHIEAEIRKRPVTIIPQSWPGNELFEIDHLGTTVLVKLNMRHAFYREVYSKLLAAIDSAPVETNTGEPGVARLAQVGIDLLILAYARAEGMRADATDYYSELKPHWGLHLKNLIQEQKNLFNR
jgi:hypothetical protein